MITVVGESLVDVVARTGHDEVTVHPGGSPANVAVALSRLGQRTALVTQIGADDYGALIRAHLESNGVDVILAGPAGQPTSRALATLDAHGAASYEFDLSWAVRGLRLAEDRHRHAHRLPRCDACARRRAGAAAGGIRLP